MLDSPESSNEKEMDKVASARLDDHEVGIIKDVKADDDELLNAIGYTQARVQFE
jgi:hypothetical protein